MPQSASSRGPVGQGQPPAELGRSTPPPRLTNDMSEDERDQYNQLAKDHKELSKLTSILS